MSRAVIAPTLLGSSKKIEYVTIESAGNASTFGDLYSINVSYIAMCSNGTNDRGILAGGEAGTYLNAIHYVTISTTGNSSAFGNLSVGRSRFAATSNLNSERGLFFGGWDAATKNNIDYITISTTGNATDFGDLLSGLYGMGATSTKGRAIISGGYDGSSRLSTIQYTTINSTGNTVDFGTLTVARSFTSATSNDTNTRCVFVNGAIAPNGYSSNTIDYVDGTILGNATDFGDTTLSRDPLGATSNGSANRGIFAGGDEIDASPQNTNIIDYITISTAGNATDFGDLTGASSSCAAASNAGTGTGTIATALNKWMNILETNIPKMLGITRSTTQLSKLMGLTLTDYTTLGDRGVIFGGFQQKNVIDYITISTTGNATDFGDLTVARSHGGACSNGGTGRGVYGTGYTNANVNVIDYITILTAGNAADFGDISVLRRGISGASNGTSDRGVFFCGITTSFTNIIDYITISTTGNATDFGDGITKRSFIGATSNDTNNRGVFVGGGTDYTTSTYLNTIEYITISTTGNATDFGDTTVRRTWSMSSSNGTNERAVSGGGVNTAGAITNVIDYFTISTTGNSSDFGDLAQVTDSSCSTSNKTNDRAVWAAGIITGGGATNVIEYVTISTTGNTTDFGDLTVARDTANACSNT